MYPFILSSSFCSVTLTAEGFIPPRSNVDSTVLTLVDVSFNGFAQDGLGSSQLTQVKHTVLEVFLKREKGRYRY